MSVLPAASPEPPPATPRDTRRELAEEMIRGSGLEIGGLHLPLVLADGVSVRYVDRMSVTDLRAHYPELAELPLVDVDVIDDGERLDTIAPASVDFIIANHFLEHCQDPIRTLGTHLSKVRPGGLLFYAVPDKRYTFDWRREVTPLQHLIDDHELGPERSRTTHYQEWVTYVDGRTPADKLEADDYSIHFHVWTQQELLALVLHCRERYGSFDIAAFRPYGIENVVVLRKHGPPIEPAVPAPAPVPEPAVQPAEPPVGAAPPAGAAPASGAAPPTLLGVLRGHLEGPTATPAGRAVGRTLKAANRSRKALRDARSGRRPPPA